MDCRRGSSGRGDDWYKIIAEALRVVSAVVRVARPGVAAAAGGDGDEEMKHDGGGFDFAPLVPTLYDAVLPRLEAPARSAAG